MEQVGRACAFGAYTPRTQSIVITGISVFIIHPCPHMYANLSKTIKEFDVSYRKGRAKISDQEFDSLVRNLKRIDLNNSYFHQNKVLPSMGNGNYEEFLETLLPETRLIVTPKIDGCAVGL